MPNQSRVACTCPACGVGESTGLCTLARGAGDAGPGSLGPSATLDCRACGYWLRDGIVLSRGVALEPEDVRALAAEHAPEDAEAGYVAPDARQLRLVPIYVWELHAAPAWSQARQVTSITLHFGRVRTREPRA